MITKDQFLSQIQFFLSPEKTVLIPDARVLYSALTIRDEFHKNVIFYDGRWKVYAQYQDYQFESQKRPSLFQAMDDISNAHLALLEQYY